MLGRILKLPRRLLSNLQNLPQRVISRFGFARRVNITPDAMLLRHEAIYSDINRLGGSRNGNVLEILGMKFEIAPMRMIETVAEVIIRRDYNFCCGDHPMVVIDIGMNVGIASISQATLNPLIRHIYSFEPLLPTFNLAVANIELNPTAKPKISTFNFGMSDIDRKCEVKYTLNEIMSISSEGTFDDCFNENAVTEQIELKRASTIIGPILRSHPSEKKFIKIDCEGAEYKIVEDLFKTNLLAEFDVAIIEWHGQNPDPILEALTKSGFSYFLDMINVEWNVGMIKAFRTS